MPRKPQPRPDRDLTRRDREEAAVYLLNADSLATMSSHFATHAVSIQARRVAGHFEKGARAPSRDEECPA